jgi:hypothetical protein
MAFRVALAFLMVAAIAACSSAGTYSGDPYSVSESRNPGFGSPKLPPRYEGSMFSDLYGGSAARAGLVPPMDQKRKVAEQDCSKPLTDNDGNLRCK